MQNWASMTMSPPLSSKWGDFRRHSRTGEGNAGIIAGLRRAIVRLWGLPVPIFPAQPCSPSGTGTYPVDATIGVVIADDFGRLAFRGARSGKSVFRPAAYHRVVMG